MQSNHVPNVVHELFADEGESMIYSFDVSADKHYAIIALGREDPDFPELWVYDDINKKLHYIDDRSTLIDMPLVKAFWAENQTDVVMVSDDMPPYFWLIRLSSGFEYLDSPEVDQPSDYMLEKNRQVVSFLV